jgi:hypothetical protein
MLKSFLFSLALVSTSLFAQSAATDSPIPPQLKDWRAWALKDLDYRACPFLANSASNAPADYICAWPGRLKLNSDAKGATFSIHWRVEAPSWIFLPGDGELWPQQVTVNAQRQPVLTRTAPSGGSAPALWLAPGNYEIAGVIPWREQPQQLNVPQSIGLIALSVDAKTVSPIQRDGAQITLGRVSTAAPEADNVELRVYRKLTDGVPAQLSTQIVIGVSGQAREETIGPALPAGFEPISLSSEWPARLDNEGRLHIQVQPGSETLTLDARATAPLTGATAHLPAAPWPKQEVWSYEANSHLRVTAATGALQLDPRQAEVPEEWQSLPTFALADGGKLVIEERSRGLASDEANRLTLQREAWLDFAGGRWFARDEIGGNMSQGWRFDVAAPFTLEQATAQNTSRGNESLLITNGTQSGLTGVEWRTPSVALGAGVRIEAAASMPVAGWQQTFDSIQATLHFPFGYKLLGAPGADAANGSWISGWTLLDIFICAIVVLVAWRLMGIVGAVVVIVYVLLGYQENGSPLWSLLAAFALALIARALPQGKLQRSADWIRRGALVLLALVALPFVASQVRYALYPQLEGGGYSYPAQDGANAISNYAGLARHKYARAKMEDQAVAGAVAPPPIPAPPPPPPRDLPVPEGIETANPIVMIKNAPKSPALETVVVTGSKIQRSDIIDHYSETTVVQTGSGTPSWNLGNTAFLSWSGPVLASQTVHLLIAPPWIVRPLRLVLVALLAWLIVRLFRNATSSRPPRGAAAGAAALVIVGLAMSTGAHAQGYPSEELLRQLRQRLAEMPKCASACAIVADAQVSANGDAIGVTLEVHAGERVAVSIPSDASAAAIKNIQVDGAADDAVVRDANGALWVMVTRGVHRVQIDYSTSTDKVALAFPFKPARVVFAGHGWDASGLSEDHLLTETLNLARARDSNSTTPTGGVQQFPPFVLVTRALTLGLQWSANTSVQRLSPAQGGFTVEIPTLGDEHVTTSGIKLVNGKVPVAMADGATVSSWESTLDKTDSLTLTAPALTDHAEIWRIVVSPTWHVEFSGVPGVGLDADDSPSDFRNFEFHPLPGEKLTMNITRPAAAQGALRAIDSVSLTSEIGQRAATHVLSFTLRASQGGDQGIALPKESEVLAVNRDGQVLNLRAIAGKLTLPVVPGEHRYDVRFRDSAEVATLVRTPVVSLGQPAANVAIHLQLPADRWLLATFGPPLGPSVLYWGELIVMIVIAYALARTRRTRLRFRDWLLLGLGFSTFSWLALLVVVAWLFAFDWRGRNEVPRNRWTFNLLQAALALLTVIALFALASAIPQGLLGQPDMHVTGNSSYSQLLRWFADRSTDALPQASALTLPLWVYKVLMLAWALWLANALIGWLREGFAAWTRGGYWREKPVAAIVVPATEPAKS